MAIKQSLLALLMDGPSYGYQLKTAFEQHTGGVWPLNIGQVYTTLTRCERDDLVAVHSTDDEGRVRYEITSKGKYEVGVWFSEAVPREDPERDELAIKLSLAVALGRKDAIDILTKQRSEAMRILQTLTRDKHRADLAGELATTLVLDRQIFAIEAEARWLDMCEARLISAKKSKSSPSTKTTK
jgi:DNA-binding PadR family transcriptional regulator